MRDDQSILEQVQDKTDAAVAKAGEMLADAGASLWEATPSEGKIGEKLGDVAARIESSGYYLSERRVRDMLDDFTDSVQEYPIPVAVAVFALGFVCGALLVRR